MFIARMVALILVILWLWPSSLHAQSEALMEAFRQGGDRKPAQRFRINHQGTKTPRFQLSK